MASSVLTRDQIAEEAVHILLKLRENTRASRPNKLADIKGAFENTVTLDFDTYFFFLRKYHFIGMDREACLQLTTDGEKIADGERRDRFLDAVQEYFASRIGDQSSPKAPEIMIDSSIDEAALPPPPPPEEIDMARAAGGNAVSPAPSSVLSRVAERARLRPRGEYEQPARPVDSKGQEMDLRYVKYDALGQGPLGTVYRGRHTALGLDVAIKEMKDIFGYFSFLQRNEVLKRLKREICAQALVRHPSVVGVLDQNCDVARPYYVLELCAGGNLRAKIDATEGKGLPLDQAIRCFLQLCYALRAAHNAGLAHNNIKPENVLFDAWGNVKVADFGFSRVVEVDPAKNMPQVFVGMGGIAYMSPEQLTRSVKDPGVIADIYSLGVLFHEMLTGQLPGRRSPLPSAINAQIPPKLDALFDQMTQDRREARYPDMDAILQDFYAIFDEGTYLKKGDLLLSSETTAPKTDNGAAAAKPA